MDRLLRWDRKHVLRFAPLQGGTAKALSDLDPQRMDTVVFVDGDQTYERSDAAIRIIIRLGGAWRLFGVLLIVPRPIRNLVYDWIARNRYGWFGKRETCRIPDPEERMYFLP